jgi:hypothetical protein
MIAMKTTIIILTLLISANFAYCQKHSIELSYHQIYGGGATNFSASIFDPSMNHEKGNILAVNYLQTISSHIKIISGLQKQNYWLLRREESFNGDIAVSNFKVETLNVPVLIQFNFLKYLFTEGGLLFHWQTNASNNNGIEKQSGIGLLFALGAQYKVRKFNLFIKNQSRIQVTNATLFSNKISSIF